MASEGEPSGLELSVEQVRTEPLGPLATAMAGRLFASCLGGSAESFARLRAELASYVPVLALGGDPAQPPSLLAVPAAAFLLDSSGRPVGLRGPRLAVELPDAVAVSIDPVTWRPLQTVPCPLEPARADGEGAFLCRGATGGVALAMTTSFAVGTRVIQGAERWAGHRIDWGQAGRLTILPYASVSDAPRAGFDREERRVLLGALGTISAEGGLRGFTGRPHGWRSDVEGLLVDTARNPDAVAHEAGHAVVTALKPGWTSGVALVLHEALADAIAFLTAFEDPAVLERVLLETGGDLRRPNEAARLHEEIGLALHRFGDDDPTNDDDRWYRSVQEVVRLRDCALDARSADVPAVYAAGGRVGDPHYASLVFSGVLYEVFCGFYEERLAASVPPFRAAIEAGEETGTLMVGSLLYAGEHRVSPRDFALALLRADEAACGGRTGGALRRALLERGVLEAAEDVDAEIRSRDAALPNVALPPEVVDEAAALSALCAACPELLPAQAAAGSVAVWSDSTGREGRRVVRLACRVAKESLPPRSQADALVPEGGPLAGDLRFTGVYASVVLDAQGRMVALNVDRPWD